MRCPFCQCPNNRVLESRSAESGQSVRRRRECLDCERRFTTYERIEFVPITVIKRNGDRESFDRSKLLRGIARACEKTMISALQQENIVDSIEAELQQRSMREIASQDIGELVLARLCGVNEVAYVRFASVYRQFQGITDFIQVLADLQQVSDPSADNPDNTVAFPAEGEKNGQSARISPKAAQHEPEQDESDRVQLY